MFFLFFMLFLFSNYHKSNCLKFIENIDNSSLINDHGYILGYFTFVDDGVAGLSYKIFPLFNSSDLILHIFPMAYNPFSNMQRMINQFSESRCKEFYKKSIYSVKMLKMDAIVPLGRFSGGFSVAVLLSNKYSCNSVPIALENGEGSTMSIEVNVYNGNKKDAEFSNHLSGSEMGMQEIIRIFLVLYILTALVSIFTVKYVTNTDLSTMMVIQRLIVIIAIFHVVICLLLNSTYSRLANSGQWSLVTSLLAELLAILCRYLELYIIVAWTLSSPRDQSHRVDVRAQVMGLCALCHVIVTLLHYFFSDGHKPAIDCSSVWDCEPHIYSVGFGNPAHYTDTVFGWASVVANGASNVIGSLFVFHLLKVGLRSTQATLRRAYLSLFCSVSLLWFWSYPASWLISSLVIDYWQYKTVTCLVTVCNICGLWALLRVSNISSGLIDRTPPSMVTVY